MAPPLSLSIKPVKKGSLLTTQTLFSREAAFYDACQLRRTSPCPIAAAMNAVKSG